MSDELVCPTFDGMCPECGVTWLRYVDEWAGPGAQGRSRFWHCPKCGWWAGFRHKNYDEATT